MIKEIKDLKEPKAFKEKEEIVDFKESKDHKG